MRGIAFALVALTVAATTSDPVAAQCYGPECERQRSGPPAYQDVRPNFHPNSVNNGQFNRSAPYDQRHMHQGQPYQGQPYQGQPYRPAPYEQAQPNRQAPHQGRPYQGQPYQGQPYHQGQPYQQPAYQAQPRPPAGYSNVPPGMGPGVAPRGPDYRHARPDGRIELRTRVTKIPKATKYAARQHHPVLNGRTVARSASPTAGAGQVTISVAEYRDLQNQARELQRMRGARAGGPNRPSGAPNGPSPFPEVRPSGMPPRAVGDQSLQRFA